MLDRETAAAAKVDHLFTYRSAPVAHSFLSRYPRLRLDSPPWPSRMIDFRAWAEYVVEWAAKDPYGFLTTVILALTPLFIASALLSWKLAKMIEARDREQKKKQKRQENIAKAKRTKKD
ncbi:small integral membrane protein 15 isoform X1 [Mugil cephalus]|nr:small integral membrane protein 15 isoform X1 [Mugil cephalus]